MVESTCKLWTEFDQSMKQTGGRSTSCLIYTDPSTAALHTIYLTSFKLVHSRLHEGVCIQLLRPA